VVDLPLPDSDELNLLVSGHAARTIYRILYEHRGRPLSMAEIRDLVGPDLGGQEHLGRRRRQLHLAFDIAQDGDGFELVGLKPDARPQAPPISNKTRAQVLSPQRCAMCGKTPIEDQVKLVVDHRIPQAWGGGDEPENLQPLCEQCNGGKRDYFETYDGYADQIATAINYEEPHRRIGELLKAFDGQWVPSDLIGIIASAQQYQEDFQKRTRELRTLGWHIDVQKRYHEGARVRVYYRATQWEPWPTDRPIAQAVRSREQANKLAARGKHSAG
jgi:hypothetical protein